jgi:hypothetical protein
MNKYNVIWSYGLQVTAENKEDAKDQALALFDSITEDEPFEELCHITVEQAE